MHIRISALTELEEENLSCSESRYISFRDNNSPNCSGGVQEPEEGQSCHSTLPEALKDKANSRDEGEGDYPYVEVDTLDNSH